MPQTDRTKCLLVDDVEENLIALEALLQRDGLDILKAQSGPEALELLLAHDDVALALLDVQMPEMNGFELAELIRGSERTRHIPLIFMTAGSREQNWQFRGYESGAVDFLYKPIDPHMLTNKASVFFELHRRKQALAHELRARTEALRINEMFMAVLSHDLRTPLQSIVAAASVLKRQPSPDKTALMADRVLGASQRMGHMIEDLLDVTRIRQAGGLALQLGPAHMQTLVQRTLDEVATSHPERPIDSTLAGDLAGTWDAERLCQVITNLVGNALHHGSADHPVRIAVDGSRPEEVSITVSNGGTIPPGLLPHLFDPFRGGEREPGRHQGLGLGLFIAHQIVRAHHGTIEARSHNDVTSFRVTLPRHAPARSPRN
ncbi:response regulator receiver sensor signal transduction histidine kinase [Acidovorax sp. KKS102]|uniref:hybrid sensor histidine kinase/response regulator n=1 Tax=Acidovorax sp. KKS102 TaxID=358220 RepID=UPI00028B4938|nr:hybrid sensor histidine kinase/response regulator [Acidovorax sp. KKS102]AFU48089.1 response regulator receiver sensor signal transduction histidine kinase [Acidovorax sp. KKS102]